MNSKDAIRAIQKNRTSEGAKDSMNDFAKFLVENIQTLILARKISQSSGLFSLFKESEDRWNSVMKKAAIGFEDEDFLKTLKVPFVSFVQDIAPNLAKEMGKYREFVEDVERCRAEAKQRGFSPPTTAPNYVINVGQLFSR